ncbi:hypothetical protein GN956_G24340 [Arapaima gigas]
MESSLRHPLPQLQESSSRRPEIGPLALEYRPKVETEAKYLCGHAHTPSVNPGFFTLFVSSSFPPCNTRFLELIVQSQETGPHTVLHGCPRR